MLFGITFPLLSTLSFLLFGSCHGDPTILLNSPMGGPYGMGIGGGHFLFDRDDVDVLYRHPGVGPGVFPGASPIAQPPTVVLMDGGYPGNTIINNGIPQAPIPGVRYVVPRRRSSRRMSSPYYRRRRFGLYG